MKQPIYLYLLLLLLTACTAERNAYNTIDYKESGNAEGSLSGIRIMDPKDKFLKAQVYGGIPTGQGELYDTFTLAAPGIYLLDFVTAHTFAYLEPGDVLKMTASGGDMLPDIKFEGDQSEVNQFILDHTKAVAGAFAGMTERQLVHSSEADMLRFIAGIREKSDRQLEERGSKMEDSVRRFVLTERESAIASICLYYKHKVNRLPKAPVPTPRIDSVLSAFDGNNTASAHRSPAYRQALQEYHNWGFHQGADERRDVKGFHRYLQQQNLQPAIQDYLLSTYATNYFIGDHAAPEEAKAVYDYLIGVLRDEACRTHVYQAYVRSTRNR